MSLFSGVAFGVLFILAISLLRKRELVALFYCVVMVPILYLFLTVL